MLSAFFSATETAFSTFNRIRMKSLASEGNKRAAMVVKLDEKYEKFISTVLIGNNIVNIGATSIATVLFIRNFPHNGATLSTVVMTLAVLIFGEITPKSLAKDLADPMAMLIAPIMYGLTVIFTPLTFLFQKWKQLLNKIFRIKNEEKVTEEEILTMIEEASVSGELTESETEIVKSALAFEDLKAKNILTPAVQVVKIDIETTIPEIKELFRETHYSRIPVYEGNPDRIIGILHEKDFYNKIVFGNSPLREVLSAPLFVSPSISTGDLLAEFQKRKVQFAVVTNEFGQVEGIVTMEDIVEELVGEIWDEHDEVYTDFEELPDGGHKVLGSARLDEFEAYFSLDKISEDENAPNTVNGWIQQEMQRIPETGEEMDYRNLHIVISSADDKRVLDCTVFVLQSGENEDSENKEPVLAE
jgi:CBS domain containing-hemolysin-like protein